ncbi:MAG TPA: acetyl-CoA carboxylase biotin carboxyl carrier protein subunit, partial [Syntrophaceae bacterium]|nr:acetyl-CoA carboxylase biotin carboxyl carrier protein subunit [Syntrophaceae bacterium]
MEITAPMPGKIASIPVNVGSQVQEEEEVIIMDAMKMEIPVYAPGAGTIK